MYNVDNLPRNLCDIMQLIIVQLVLDRPGILLREIQAEVKEVVGMDLAESTICQFLHGIPAHCIPCYCHNERCWSA